MGVVGWNYDYQLLGASVHHPLDNVFHWAILFLLLVLLLLQQHHRVCDHFGLEYAVGFIFLFTIVKVPSIGQYSRVSSKLMTLGRIANFTSGGHLLPSLLSFHCEL
jgi:hypothetical protein